MNNNPWIVMGNSRIGRLRFIAYSFGLTLLCLPGLLIAQILTNYHHGMTGMVLMLAMQVLICGLNILLAVRRLHDFNASGWWAILVIPVAFFDPPRMVGPQPTPIGILLFVALSLILSIYVLILLLRPGDFDKNRFGLAPAPNTVWVIAGTVIAIISPGIASALYIFLVWWSGR